MEITHKDLVSRGTKWIKKHTSNIAIPNCSIVAEDLTTATSTGETPDIIGWASWCSVLIEVKASRSDFLRDKKKNFRGFLLDLTTYFIRFFFKGKKKRTLHNNIVML